VRARASLQLAGHGIGVADSGLFRRLRPRPFRRFDHATTRVCGCSRRIVPKLRDALTDLVQLSGELAIHGAWGVSVGTADTFSFKQSRRRGDKTAARGRRGRLPA
jgi:hypothetical protein